MKERGEIMACRFEGRRLPGSNCLLKELYQARCHKRRKEGGRKERIIDCDRIQ